jgi:formylglycine-generating enzyme required for sulfatase activity
MDHKNKKVAHFRQSYQGPQMLDSGRVQEFAMNSMPALRDLVRPRFSGLSRPRENVSWYEAVAFCRWLSNRLGYEVRLPTEFEWQQAATSGDPARKYPWLGDWDAGRCNSSDNELNRTTAVGMYPEGGSVQGVEDLAGNVWEWCLNKYEDPTQTAVDGSDDWRAVRGGSWLDPADHCRATFRGVKHNHLTERLRGASIGFRIIRPDSHD